MPRDSNGNYNLPAVYHAEPGTLIRSAQHNQPFDDVATALTGSLPRNGSAPMNAPLKVIPGTSGNPSIQASNAPGQGIYWQSGKAVFTQAPGGLYEAGFGAYPDTDKAKLADIATGSKAVGQARLVSTGTGLAGGGDLSADRTLALSAGSIASLAKADSAVQPGFANVVAALGYTPAAVNDSTSTGETDFPIGTIIIALGSVNRNQTATVWLSTVNSAAFITTGGGAGAGTALAGTWRAIGVQAGATSVLMQRVS